MKTVHIHLVSDETGETVQHVFRASLTYFQDIEFTEHIWSLVRTKKHIEKVLRRIEEQPGPVFFTIGDEEKREMLEEACEKIGVKAVAVLDQSISSLADYLGVEKISNPMSRHLLDEAYFKRIEAMDFAIRHDDGQNLHNLKKADVIVIGVSRTSKSPVCMYLANRGLKSANIPFVINEKSVPEYVQEMERENLKNPFIIGLDQNINHLIEIRKNRLKMLKTNQNTNYTNLENVRDEVTCARKLYRRKKWAIIDVTEKSIEETAATIIQLYTESGRHIF
ncbi:MAG: pyruvate, water dikinase regulatory protein [Alphaproteobacteria bacterium]